MHRAGLAEARFDASLDLFSDWDLLARLTTDRDPLVLPAIACFYSTDSPDRISGGPRRRPTRSWFGAACAPPAGLGEPEPGAWALGPEALQLVLDRIPPSGAAVVECGSGESTIAIGRLLRSRGSGRLQALEHHRGWAAEVRRRVEAEGLGEQVEVIDAPLGPHELAPAGCQWYAAGALERIAPRIDVLLVDGPPASDQGRLRARYPALPALADRLAAGATVDPRRHRPSGRALDPRPLGGRARNPLRAPGRAGDRDRCMLRRTWEREHDDRHERAYTHNERNENLAADRARGAAGVRGGRGRMR